MPKYMILLTVQGSDQFAIDAPDEDTAWAIANSMVDEDRWPSEHEDLSYEIADVSYMGGNAP